jgi:hypothetical protein
MRLSLEEVVVVLDVFDMDPSHGAVWNYVHDLAQQSADGGTAADRC